MGLGHHDPLEARSADKACLEQHNQSQDRTHHPVTLNFVGKAGGIDGSSMDLANELQLFITNDNPLQELPLLQQEADWLSLCVSNERDVCGASS